MTAATLSNAAAAKLSNVNARLSNHPLSHPVRLSTALPLPSLSSQSSSRRANAVPIACAKSTTTAATASRISADVPVGVSTAELLAAAEAAALKGAEVVLAAVDLPRSISYKGATDLVTNTDRDSEAAILSEIERRFPSHLVLGEEGGVIGNSQSEYLWCVDPLDGTTNFAHAYPSFAVSVAVLLHSKPIAACVVEFAGGPGHWVTRTFTASAGGGAFCDGRRISVSSTDQVSRSLLVTGFGYEHDDAWTANMELFKHYTDVTRGVRRLGAAAVDMCHVALGIVDAFWEFRLKPWDMAAGALIVEEAGGIVSRMEGGPFTVFDRTILASNGHLHQELLSTIAPTTNDLAAKGCDFSPWFRPQGYE